MPTYRPAPKEVIDMANELLCDFDGHKPLLDAKVRLDFMFAYGERDDNGKVTTPAIVKAGVIAHGQSRVLGPKDRAMGRGDGEVMIDADWWDEAAPEEQKALLDHELYHFAMKTKRAGGLAERDDMGRPMLRLRKHDYEFGWFNVIALRHGDASQERIQANRMMVNGGQYYWPNMFVDTKTS